MSINSKKKGSRGEREAAKVWNDLFNTRLRRSQQFCGASDESDDLIGLDGFSFEVKRDERLNLYKAIEKTEDDAKDGAIPIVLHRKNKQRWLVTLFLEDLPDAVNQLANLGEPECQTTDSKKK